MGLLTAAGLVAAAHHHQAARRFRSGSRDSCSGRRDGARSQAGRRTGHRVSASRRHHQATADAISTKTRRHRTAFRGTERADGGSRRSSAIRAVSQNHQGAKRAERNRRQIPRVEDCQRGTWSRPAPMLQESDPELRAMAQEEIAQTGAGCSRAIEEELKFLLLPKDPNDEKDVVLEIRAGTGGDEATLFADEIFRMYSRFAETRGWKVEVTSASESAVGGLKEVIALISGNKVYSQLKYESGVHRVQRVPATETAGTRAHLGGHGGGAARSRRSGNQRGAEGHPHRHVLLLGAGRPEREHDVFRGAAHAPADGHRGFLPGRKIADQESRAKRCACCARGSTRWSWKSSRKRSARSGAAWWASGDRSEKIRTYNFPQNRVTDHRIGFTLHQLDQVMEGKLEPFVDALTTHLPDRKAQRARRRAGRLRSSRTGWQSDHDRPHGASAGPAASRRRRCRLSRG